jgi:putative phage-type endonuclease
VSYHGVEIPTESRDDWLEKRRQGIGASDVAGILGVSPWSSPFSVWADKVHQVEKDPTESMSWGQKLEAVVADEFEEVTGLYVHDRQMLVAHPEYPWATATVDGLEYESYNAESRADSIGLYEGKTEALFGRWDEIPDQYQIQCQWQFFVTGHDTGHLVCLHGGRQFEIYDIERDQGLINMIVDRVTDFRGKHLTGGLTGELPPPPEVDEHLATTRVIADLWSEPVEGAVVDLPTEVAFDLGVLRGVKAEISRLESETKRLENRVKAALEDAEVGLVSGVPAVSWKSQKRKSYVVAEAEFRVLRLMKEKE